METYDAKMATGKQTLQPNEWKEMKIHSYLFGDIPLPLFSVCGRGV